MKAVILAGNPDMSLLPLANYYPKLAFPIATDPLIIHLLDFLEKNSIIEIAIVFSSDLKWDRSIIDNIKDGNGSRLKVTYFEEKIPRGTAGCLKELEGFLGSSPFVVFNSNFFIQGLDLSEILNYHLTQEALATIVVEQSNSVRKELENIEIDMKGFVKKINTLHHSRDKRRSLIPSGIFIFNPCVLNYINKESYMDIKEQLLPLLNTKGIPIYAYERKGATKRINSLEDYFQVNREVLLDESIKKETSSNSKNEIMDQIWIGKNTRISPKAYLLGPIVIGDNCIIEDDAQIIGPTSISNGSYIEKEVLVRESIIWQKSHLMSKSRIEFSLVGESSVISKNKTIRNAVVLQDKKLNVNFNSMLSFTTNGTKVFSNRNGRSVSFFYNFLRRKVFLINKRLLDVLISFIGLLLFSPLFVIIAILIKRDSPGPVLFSQKRCGLEGENFKMFKFRTMIKDANNLQAKLWDKNDAEGPMFKMENDTRLTGIGRFLRKTSLDELPQFLNILKGEMSLVGPRPLVIEEMKFASSWRDIRLKVKPGLTGVWQVNNRHDLSFNSWIMGDIFYVKNQSLWLDIKILLKTPVVVLWGKGAV